MPRFSLLAHFSKELDEKLLHRKSPGQIRLYTRIVETKVQNQSCGSCEAKAIRCEVAYKRGRRALNKV